MELLMIYPTHSSARSSVWPITVQEEKPIEQAIGPLTDEEAQKQLPVHAPVRLQYQEYRIQGDTPEVALQKTLTEWRELCRIHAFVPHRRGF